MRFVIPGPPIPKARARTVRLKNGGVASYTPDSTAAYARKVAMCARTAGVRRIEGGVYVGIYFYLPDRRVRDLDNLQKSIWDALQGIAYENDNQIEESQSKKLWDPAHPRAVVTIEALPDQTKGEAISDRPVDSPRRCGICGTVGKEGDQCPVDGTVI